MSQTEPMRRPEVWQSYAVRIRYRKKPDGEWIETPETLADEDKMAEAVMDILEAACFKIANKFPEFKVDVWPQGTS